MRQQARAHRVRRSRCAVRVGKHEITLSGPIRLRQNFARSLIDRERNLRGGGDLARYLIFAGYSVRM